MFGVQKHMSLNQILGTSFTNSTVCFHDLEIDGRIKLNPANTAPGYRLQTYATGKAKFLPPQEVKILRQDVFGVNSDFANLDATEENYTFEFSNIIDDNFVIADNSIKCALASRYMVLYKFVTKTNLSKYKINVSIDNMIKPEFSFTQSSIVSNEEDMGIFCVFIRDFEFDERLRFSRTIEATTASGIANFELVDDFDDEGISNITIIRLYE